MNDSVYTQLTPLGYPTGQDSAAPHGVSFYKDVLVHFIGVVLGV